jgi:hypothetical protein
MRKFLLPTRGQRVSDGPLVASSRRERRADRMFRLGLEPLEGRSLLSTVTVHIVDDAFNPDPVTIHVGDTGRGPPQHNLGAGHRGDVGFRPP